MVGPLTQSYVHGASNRPLIGVTIGGLLERAARQFGQHPALVVCHQRARLSYAQLLARVDRLAAALIALGLRPGDRLGIWSPNNVEWVLTQFATARIGVILVNINPAYRTAELRHALELTGCNALIVATRFKSSDYPQMLHELLPELAFAKPGELHAKALPQLRTLLALGDRTPSGFLSFNRLEAEVPNVDVQQVVDIAESLQFDDPINIQFTSGTTGAPKAATLTHHNIVNNALLVGRAMELGPDDRLCVPVPMYHCFGMVLGTLTAIAAGATAVLPSEGFDARATLEAVASQRCTALHGVPTMFIAQLDEPDFQHFDLSTLRTGVIAGAPCPVELMKRLVQDMHLREITIAYGMTETGPVSFQTSVHDPIERRVTTVGRVLPHTEVKIVDEDSRVVPVGVAGELLTRGYCVMRGYWNDPKKTRETIDPAGWIRSGDIATLDDEGYCQIVGRLRDMLIRGGENIYPREIEEFLFTHPKIEDAQVIGVPDPKFGEEICAWIRLRPGACATVEEIREFCKGKIAHFKIPRYVKIVEEFPLTVTGKVQKFAMREQMAEELARTCPADGHQHKHESDRG